MQNVLEIDVKSHEAWLKSEIYHIVSFSMRHWGFDLDLVS